MRLGGIEYESLVDGPGIRVAIFAQGCDLGCPKCHNPDSHSRHAGREYTVREVIRLMTKPGPGKKKVKGVTFSGGEPFLQAGDFATVGMAAKQIGWDIVTYTGRLFEDLAKMDDPGVKALLRITDYLIDGPFVYEKRDLSLKFKGSENQRIIDMDATRRQDGRIKLYYGT